jgi:cell division protein FtsB
MSGNGNGTDWKTWALGILFTLFLATGGATYNSIDNRVTTLETKDTTPIVVDVAVLKKELEGIRAQQAETTQAIKDLKTQQQSQQVDFRQSIKALEARQKELMIIQQQILFELTRPR